MRTITTHHLNGSIILLATIVKSTHRDFATVGILDEAGSLVADVNLILSDADTDVIEEAVAAFNSVMARGAIKQAAE
jgi:hypothetical protein